MKKKLKPNKVYKVKDEELYYYTNNEGELKGSYMTKVAAEEGLNIYIEEDKERKLELK